MTKAELNARLTTPLSASKLKKTKIDDLKAMVDAETPKARTPRRLPAHTFCEPAKKLEDVKPIRAGTKRALLAAALLKGATMEQLMKATGWKKDVVGSAFKVDLGSMGYGVRRDANEVYHLVLPKKVKRPAIREAGKTVEEVFVAACR